MGKEKENMETIGHAQETGPLDAFNRFHFGDQGIDDRSGNIGIDGLGDMIEAASSQSNFDSVATGIHGSWYTTKPTAYKVASFRWHNALKVRLGV